MVDLYPPSKWVANYSGKVADATSTCILFDKDDHTRMEYSSDIKPKGIFTKLVLRLVKFAIKRIFSKEMDESNSRLEADRRT
jgi:carbon monoxide dehydrogenase subunit G